MALNVSSTLAKLSIITSPPLLQGIIRLNAPSLKLDWATLLAKSPQKLACIIDQRLREFGGANMAEKENVYSVLSAIANVSSESNNFTFMQRQITQIGLQGQFALFNFGITYNAITTANIAAWVYVKSNDDDEQIPEDKREKLKMLWQRLMVISDNVEKSHDSCTFDITEQTTTPEAAQAGLHVFMEHYAEKLKELSGLKNYPIHPSFATHGNFIRYTFTTPQYPHDTTQTKGEDFYIGRDPNATGFIIDYYFARNYIKVTRVTDKAVTRRIANSFAKHVLGAKVEDKAQKHYPLSMFRTRNYKDRLTIPPEHQSGNDRVWVSAIECAYLTSEGQKPEIYRVRDFDGDDILENIEKHFPVSNYPIELREILEIRISFSLSHVKSHNFAKKAKNTPNTYHIDIKPTGKNPFAQIRQVCEEHRTIITKVLKNCDLTGKLLGEIGGNG